MSCGHLIHKSRNDTFLKTTPDKLSAASFATVLHVVSEVLRELEARP